MLESIKNYFSERFNALKDYLSQEFSQVGNEISEYIGDKTSTITNFISHYIILLILLALILLINKYDFLPKLMRLLSMWIIFFIALFKVISFNDSFDMSLFERFELLVILALTILQSLELYLSNKHKTIKNNT